MIMGINIVKYGNTTLMDITDTTAEAEDVLSTKYFYSKAGVKTQGSIADGNEIGYGLTDGTLPLVGVAKVGYAEI